MGEKAKKAAENVEKNENGQETFKDTSGLKVIQGGSINDYFKLKMEQLQAKRKLQTVAVKTEKPEETETTEVKIKQETPENDETPIVKTKTTEVKIKQET